MPPVKCNVRTCNEPAVLKRPKNGAPMCKECFFFCFEIEVHFTIVRGKLFKRGDKVAIGASGGKDSTVLAYILKLLNERYDYGLDLVLLSIDEGITGYRDDSLETVKQNRDDYQLPLKILSYKDLYGWTMDEIVSAIGKKNNCTFCGVFRRQALDRGAALIGADMIVTGHNADDVAETVIMNILRGDLARLTRCTNIVTQGEGTIPRCKPLMYAYEKEIVMYAHYKKLVYFSTECIYSPEAYRGVTREYIKELERVRPSCIMDIIRSGEQIKATEKLNLPARRTCTRCGFVASQEICKACVLLEGLNTGNPKLGVGKSNKAKRAMGIKVLDGSENKSKREKPIDESKRKIRREKKKSSYYCAGGCSSGCKSDKAKSKEAEDEDDLLLLEDSNIYEEEGACGLSIDCSEFSSLNISADDEKKSISEDQKSLLPEVENSPVPEDMKSPVTKTEEDEEVVCKCSTRKRAPPKPRHSQKAKEEQKPRSFKEATYNFELLFALMRMDNSNPESKIDFSFLDETWKTMQKKKKESHSVDDTSMTEDVNEPKTAAEALKDLKIKDIIPPSTTKCWEDPKTWVLEDEDDPGSLYCKMVNKWLFTTFVKRWEDPDLVKTEQSDNTTVDVQPSTSKVSPSETLSTSEDSQKSSEKKSVSQPKTEKSTMSSQKLLESSDGKSTIESFKETPDLESQSHNDSDEQPSGEATIVKATPKRIRPSLMLPEMMHKATNNLDF